MVILLNFQDIFKSLHPDAAFTLPTYKENLLGISFENDNHDGLEVVYSGSEPVLPFANSDVFNAEINSWRRLTAIDDGCKAVYEVTFVMKDSNFKFKAGDTIGIIPKNSNEEVEFIISHLDLSSEADLTFTVKSQKGTKVPNHIPLKSTLRHVLQNCVDLRCILKKLFLLALSKYTKDEYERKVLEYLCSKEGASAYQTQILSKNVNLIDILTIFKSCRPPLQILLAHLPRLLPRPYSIVNSGLKTPDVITICFSVISLENDKKGLTTGWLESLLKNESHLNLEHRMRDLKITDECTKVPIYLRKNLNSFCLPECLEKPMILIGPGTGLAPFMGFLEEIEFRQSNLDFKVGDIWLLFGCRNPKLDFIYEKELNRFLENGVLNKLSTAFSRVDNTDIKYIQDIIKENSSEIVQKINSGTSIFICGDVKNMAVQVKDALISSLVENGRTKDEADKLISQMEREKRYVVDSWR